MKLRDDLAEFEATAVRDLMAILATTTAPVSGTEESASHRVKASHAPASLQLPTVEPYRMLHTNQFSTAHASQIPAMQQLETNYNPAYFEAKMISLPAPQSKIMDDQMSHHLGVIPKMRSTRNGSTASTSSTTSSVCTDASFEMWTDEMAAKCNVSASDQHQGLYSTLFGNANEMPNLNFEGDELWSLLDDLP